MYDDIVDRHASLHRLFDQASALQKDHKIDLEVKSAIESYLCVRTYAHFEISVRTILLQFVGTVSDDESVSRFVESQLRRLPSLSYSELVKLIGRFSKDWTNRIKSSVTDKMREALNSLVNIRNSIAHGGNTIISLEDLRDYFSSIHEIIKIVFDACASDASQAQI